MKMERMIGIIGTRRRDTQDDYEATEQLFMKYHKDGDWIVSGGCPKGGDRFAEIIAKKYGIPILIFYPNWKRYGRAVGILRNGLIAEAAHLMIACVSYDRSGGTEDTLKKFKNFNVECNEIVNDFNMLVSIPV